MKLNDDEKKKIIIVVVLILLALFLYLINPKDRNGKSHLENFLEKNSYKLQGNTYKLENIPLDKYFEDKSNSNDAIYKAYIFNIENKVYSIQELEYEKKTKIEKSFKANYYKDKIDFTFELNNLLDSNSLSGEFDIKEDKYICNKIEGKDLCDLVYPKVLDFANKALEFNSKKEVINYEPDYKPKKEDIKNIENA